MYRLDQKEPCGLLSKQIPGSCPYQKSCVHRAIFTVVLVNRNNETEQPITLEYLVPACWDGEPGLASDRLDEAIRAYCHDTGRQFSCLHDALTNIPDHFLAAFCLRPIPDKSGGCTVVRGMDEEI